jgi:hypothetical protein
MSDTDRPADIARDTSGEFGRSASDTSLSAASELLRRWWCGRIDNQGFYDAMREAIAAPSGTASTTAESSEQPTKDASEASERHLSMSMFATSADYERAKAEQASGVQTQGERK